MLACLALLGACATDTSSYYYAQKQIQSGQMGFHRTVRVNEYINAFPQDWLTVPAGQQAVLRVDPMVETLPGVGDNMLYQIAVKTRDMTAQEAADRIAISFVIDTSGSMTGEKLEDTRTALKAAIMELKTGDAVSIVTFDDIARVLVSNVTIASDTRPQLVSQIDSIEAGGSTNIQDGLVVGYRELAKLPNVPAQRLVLLTDGQSSVHVTSPRDIAMAAGVDVIDGAKISTIGLGLSVNEALLRSIAEKGQGHYYFADTSDTLTGILREGLGTTVRPVILDTELTLALPEGLELVNLYGADAEFADARSTIALGALHVNDWRILILEARVTSSAAATPTASLRYQRADTGAAEQLPAVSVALDEPVNKDVLRNAILFGNAMALRTTGEFLEQAKHDEALAVLNLQINNNRILAKYDDSPQVARELTNLQTVRSSVLKIKMGEMDLDGQQVSTPAAPPVPPAAPAGSTPLQQLVLIGLDMLSGTPPGTWLTITKLTSALAP